MQNRNNHSLTELSAYIGAGRAESQQLASLSLEQYGGDGILWPVIIDGSQQWIWCKEVHWCEWISPVISVSSIDDIPPDMLQIVAEWASSQFSALLNQTLSWGVPVKGCVPIHWMPIVHVRANALQLDFCLIDWPLNTVKAISHQWAKADVTSDADRLFCEMFLQIGTITTSLQMLQQWCKGDGIMLSRISKVEQSQLWLGIGDFRVVAVWQETGEFIVDDKLMSEGEVRRDENALDAIPLTIYVEIGSVNLPLAELRNLQPGDCISGRPQFDQHVSLILQGKKIGSGDLIKVGEHWVVRIAEISQYTSSK